MLGMGQIAIVRHLVLAEQEPIRAVVGHFYTVEISTPAAEVGQFLSVGYMFLSGPRVLEAQQGLVS